MDDIEAEYYAELLPDEEWAEYDKRHRMWASNHIVDIMDLVEGLYGYCQEQEGQN